MPTFQTARVSTTGVPSEKGGTVAGLELVADIVSLGATDSFSTYPGATVASVPGTVWSWCVRGSSVGVSRQSSDSDRLSPPELTDTGVVSGSRNKAHMIYY